VLPFALSCEDGRLSYATMAASKYLILQPSASYCTNIRGRYGRRYNSFYSSSKKWIFRR